jgi:hypothetical protein
MKNIKLRKGLILAVIVLFIGASVVQSTASIEKIEQVSMKTSVSRPYDGHLRVYVVEPVSRWNNYDGDPYHFGFLDFAIDEELSIDYLDTYNKQVTWNAQQAGYQNVEEENIMVMAAVFNPEDHLKYAYPPSTNPFDAYYVDAAAAATPGTTGENTVNENFTHTVFVEEGTATWCVYCPGAAENLYEVYQSGDYPFYFVALIEGEVQKARNRLIYDYNLAGYPTCFFDGGYYVVVGASSTNTFRSRVKSCGARDVHELDLSISLVWAGSGDLDIEVTITNNEEMPNLAPDAPEIDGQTRGAAGTEYEYTFNSVDIDGDDIYYYIDWDDGSNTGWLGPYASGTDIKVNHTWSEQETYIILAKAKDTNDLESDWATLEVTMPKNKAFNFDFNLLSRLFELYPNAFPIIRQILKL